MEDCLVPRHGDRPDCWLVIDGKPPCDEHEEATDGPE